MTPGQPGPARDRREVSVIAQSEHLLTFDYVNYRGESSTRRVIVQAFQFRRSDWHPEPQWLLHAYDLDKDEWRDFAMRDMTNVRYTLPAAPARTEE